MIRLKLTDQDSTDIAEALDDPATTEKSKYSYWIITGLLNARQATC